jgi:hypothetical protein
MSFMQRQITRKQTWIKVETTHGTEFLDAVSLGLNLRDSQTATHPLTDKERETAISKLSDCCEGTVQEWGTIRGYGARLSAPGYMDCTEWSIFDTELEAEAYLDDIYGDDEDEPEDSEDSDDK